MGAMAAVMAALAACSSAPDQPVTKPPLAVMTTLPLFWNDGDAGAKLTVDQRAPVIRRLADAFRVAPLDLLTAEGLRPFTLLVLAQPRALAPAELVLLDTWVREGGRLLIFADPMLDWPSPYGPGDRRSPLPMSLLDPLLEHWGLRLDQGATNAERSHTVTLAGHAVAVQSAGRWHLLRGDCAIADKGLRANCVIGKGRATLIADADMLDLALGESENGNNGAALLALLRTLQSESPPLKG